MAWADELIARPMGFEYGVLFPRARDALSAYTDLCGELPMPFNICRVAMDASKCTMPVLVCENTGLAHSIPVHLYGYRTSARGKLALDPHCTGFLAPPATDHAIVSFGPKKMIGIGSGGAFLTSDLKICEEMQKFSGFPSIYEGRAQEILKADFLFFLVESKRLSINLWDRYLGDSLRRIPAEQIMPWRVMRRAWSPELRDRIVRRLRGKFDVNILYQPITGSNEWGDTVLNFWGSDKDEIKAYCAEINEVVNGR